jgi:antitoxin component YwqK of YwqJK toxin-antitoxin module
MKFFISLITFFAFSNYLFSQEKLTIGQSEKVIYSMDYENNELDSVVFISENGRFCKCDEIEVFFDKEKKNLAYKSFQIDDTCKTLDYWKDGSLKKLMFYVWDENIPGAPNWTYHERYCKNGQAIYKGYVSNYWKMTDMVIYYCNGNKKVQRDSLGEQNEGKVTSWYQNGNIETEFYFKNREEVGDWKYYNVQGKLIKTEFYRLGKLTKTVNH